MSTLAIVLLSVSLASIATNFWLIMLILKLKKLLMPSKRDVCEWMP